MVAFISGHRNLTDQEFFDKYKALIDQAVERGDSFVICDYEGADELAQRYLHFGHNYTKVTVYHMFDAPRRLINPKWQILGGFQSDVERDAQCTKDSDYDIAWSRRTGSGTEQNLQRREMFHKLDLFTKAKKGS